MASGLLRHAAIRCDGCSGGWTTETRRGVGAARGVDVSGAARSLRGVEGDVLPLCEKAATADAFVATDCFRLAEEEAAAPIRG